MPGWVASRGRRPIRTGHWRSAKDLGGAPDRLVLPHPRMGDRGFVLAPLAEIAPGWRHPLTAEPVSRMLAALGPDALSGMTPLPPGGGLSRP